MTQINQVILENWRDELNSAAIFRTLAELERKPRQRMVFIRLADIERGHAQYWAALYEQTGGILPRFNPRRRTRLLQWVAACPPNTLNLSLGFDIGGKDRLVQRLNPVTVTADSAESAQAPSSETQPK